MLRMPLASAARRRLIASAPPPPRPDSQGQNRPAAPAQPAEPQRKTGTGQRG